MEKHLGAQLGMLGVLHTWTRQMEYHPHIHYIVAQGGLTPAGGWPGAKTRSTSSPSTSSPPRRASRCRKRYGQKTRPSTKPSPPPSGTRTGTSTSERPEDGHAQSKRRGERHAGWQRGHKSKTPKASESYRR